MGKGRPFLEVFTCALSEDYWFPILELLVLLCALWTFFSAGLAGVSGFSSDFVTVEAFTHNLLYSYTWPLIILVGIPILKNIAYGLGSDVEKGIIQTLFSYPLTRGYILTARLLSALVIPLLLFLGISIFGLFLFLPDIILASPSTVFLTYAAQLSPVLLTAGLLLLLALRLKQGVPALLTGLTLCFVLFVIFNSIANSIAQGTGSDWSLKIYAVITPNLALQEYYLGTLGLSSQIWVPSFSEVLLYVLAGYLLVAVVFIIAYVYFKRWLRI
jgi:ABC-type transport system involved in multi-copper enzyme maturation permease subunit